MGALGALAGLAVVCWLAQALGHPSPVVCSRAVVLLAVVVLLVETVRWTARRVRRSRRERSLAPVVPLVLLTLALAVRLVGLDHEVAEGYYLDEGTYSHHAAQINRGQVVQRDFVYPHLLYYVDAFVLWAGRLFRGAVTGAFGLFYGLAPGEGTRRMLLRLVVAIAGAVTVLPVHALGRRIGGLGSARGEWAGLLGGLLIVVSPLYNDGSHLAICDVPAALFAALCLALCARLDAEESARGYLLAGAAAGLAAATKYPAGLVAVAPAAVWLAWRLRGHRSGEPAGWRQGGPAGLAIAGLSALAVFLAANPGLLVYPAEAFGDGRSVFFGSRQYGGAGWFGAVPPSASLWYLGHLAYSFGVPVLLGGLVGSALLPPGGRRRLAVLLPFPVVYLGLLFALDVVVSRNLYPALPPLAAFLGAGLAALLGRAANLARPRFGRRAAIVAIAVAGALLLAPATARTAYQEIGLARPGTRGVAREWIRENVPRGAAILREAYTPDFDPREYEAARRHGQRFVAAMPVARIAERGYDFVLVSTGAHRRFFAEQGNTTDREIEMRERYRTIFTTFRRVARFPGSRTRRGPGLRLYEVPVDPAAAWRAHLFGPEELFVPDPAMRRRAPMVLTVAEPDDWILARGTFGGGAHRVRARGTVEREPSEAGSVVVRTRDGEEVARAPIVRGFAHVDLPAPDRYFFYLELPAGSRVEAVGIARVEPRSEIRGAQAAESQSAR